MNVLIALVLAVWIVGFGSAVLALGWNLPSRPRRLYPALFASCVALGSNALGLDRFHLHASKTVNGHLLWSLNSDWFFVSALVLGAVALGLTIWNLWRTSPRLALKP